MWKLNEIYAQNICAFKELKYTINQGVTTLIFGDNRDNDSQKSNGSGKSALIECIALGITGSPLRKIKNDEIINDTTDEAFVELQFSNSSNNESFVIERRIYRKGSADVSCYLFRGKEFAVDEAVLPSIDSYNKFILETLGLTKDELFNNFILSKYKYQNFLQCSDTDKKNIINRFSNGLLVDEAIERIQADIKPVEKSLKNRELEQATIDGRIEALSEQIIKEKEQQENKLKSHEEKIKDIKNSITEKRSSIRTKIVRKDSYKTSREELQRADVELQQLQYDELSLETILKKIQEIIKPYSQGKMTDWQSVFINKKSELEQADKDHKRWELSYQNYKQEVERLTLLYEQVDKEYKDISSVDKENNKNSEEQLYKLKKQLVDVNDHIDKVKKERRTLSASIEELRNKLNGLISCPSCGYEFLNSNIEFDSNKGRIELIQKNEMFLSYGIKLNEADKEIESIENLQGIIQQTKREKKAKQEDWREKLGKIQGEYQEMIYQRDQSERLIKHVENTIIQLESEINGIETKVFDEAFELLDTVYKNIENNEKVLKEEICTLESSIATLESTIQELNEFTGNNIIASLEASLKECRVKSQKVVESITRIEKELQRLEEQEQHFVHFKTFLANTKIEALSKITNEFLKEIGSDIRIRFSGYTVLKTGKVREKISVTLIRAGLDCGSFGKFSLGEAARVNLATILAMQKLINSNCDDDKGLDLLVLDEILEAVDEEGLASMFSSLNRIGTTTLVVSHGNIAEAYPYKTKIVKEHGESKIE